MGEGTLPTGTRLHLFKAPPLPGGVAGPTHLTRWVILPPLCLALVRPHTLPVHPHYRTPTPPPPLTPPTPTPLRRTPR